MKPAKTTRPHLLIVSLCLIVPGISLAYGSNNLLPGGEFLIDKHWGHEGNVKRVSFSTNETGKRCLVLGSHEPPFDRIEIKSEAVPFQAGGKYSFAYRYRSEDAFMSWARIECHFFSGSEYCGTQKIHNENTPVWKTREYLFLQPKNTTHVKVILRINGPGTLTYDFVQIRELSKKEAEIVRLSGKMLAPPVLPSKGQRSLPANGGWRVDQNSGVWEMFDPSGIQFWNIGVTAIGLWNERSAKKMGERLKSQEAALGYYEELSHRVQSWGFNSAGAWNNVDKINVANRHLRKVGKKEVPFFVCLRSSDESVMRHLSGVDKKSICLLDRKGGMITDSSGYPLADPFNLKWRAAYEEMVRSKLKSIPAENLVGVFIENEMNWAGVGKFLYSESCRAEWVRWTSEKYGGDIGALNRKWSTSFTGFAELRGGVPPLETPEQEYFMRLRKSYAAEKPVVEDLREFTRHVISNFISFTGSVVKKQAPASLVVSERLCPYQAIGDFEGFRQRSEIIIDLYRAYDVVAVNLYPAGGDHFSPEQIALLEWVHQKTGRPVIIGEWSIHAEESGFISKRWRWQNVETYAERGRGYENCLAQLVNLPFVVGAHWYNWANGESDDPRNAGIVEDDNEPNPVFLHSVTNANFKTRSATRSPTFKGSDILYQCHQP